MPRPSASHPDGDRAIATRPFDTRRLSYAALLIALALTGAYAEAIPNFEVLTVVVFGAGILLGARDGMLVGAIIMSVYTLLNPYGPAHPVVMAAQVAGMAVAGAAGALFRRTGLPERAPAVRAAGLAVTALLVTVVYDLLTNLATGVVFGQLGAVLLAGIPFALWHSGYNVFLFVTLGTPLSGIFARYAARLA